jgi:hypothetical protein
MESFDRDRIQELLVALVHQHEGDWLLVGGGAVAVWLSERRVTQDVDLVPFDPSPEARYRLLDLAYDLGLPIEAVNSAADFFVRRIPDWREMTIPWVSGRRGAVFRPSATLLVLTKLRRASERDVADCLAALAAAPEEVDRERLLAALDAAPEGSDAVMRRREALRAALERGS